MKFKTAFITILLLATAHLARAQSPPVDPLAENLFPPELLLFYQSELGLSEEQRNTFAADIHKAKPVSPTSDNDFKRNPRF